MRIDWAQLLLEIRSKRISARAIAGLVDADPHTIYALIEGRMEEPKHSIGERIRDLHGRICDTGPTQA